MIAEVIVNAIEPAAKTVRGLIRVASVSNRMASLSVSSAIKIVKTIVAKAPASPESEITRRRETAICAHALGSVARCLILCILCLLGFDDIAFEAKEEREN